MKQTIEFTRGCDDASFSIEVDTNEDKREGSNMPKDISIQLIKDAVLKDEIDQLRLNVFTDAGITPSESLTGFIENVAPVEVWFAANKDEFYLCFDFEFFEDGFENWLTLVNYSIMIDDIPKLLPIYAQSLNDGLAVVNGED